MKKALSLIILMTIMGICLADPGWEPVIYTNSTVAYCHVKIDEINAVEGDLVGAFVEGECRGVGDISLSENDSYSTLNIQGNIVEEVSFLVWDQSIDTICSVEFMTITDPGNDIGYPPDCLPIFAFSGNSINYNPVLELPESLVINYPNPFNPKTRISFSAPGNKTAQLAIYNIKGELVRKTSMQADSNGKLSYTWQGVNDHGNPVASGIYLARVTTETKNYSRKMLMIK